MITYYKSTIDGKELVKLGKFEKGSWIHTVNPTQHEIKELANTYNLNNEIMLDGLDQNELPRLHTEENADYIFTKAIKDGFKLSTILIILGKNFILTISQEELSIFNDIQTQKTCFITTSERQKCLLTLLSLIDQEFETTVTNLVKQIHIRKSDFYKLTEKDMETLLYFEEFLNNLVSTTFYVSILYNKMLKKMRFNKQNKILIKDLLVEAEESANMCKSSLQTISNLREYYSIILSNKINKTIKILTIFTILLSIPAMIGAIYGMNIKLPWQEHPLAFLYIITSIIILLVLVLIFFKKKRIL